jgi:hypothetical protein
MKKGSDRRQPLSEIVWVGDPADSLFAALIGTDTRHTKVIWPENSALGDSLESLTGRARGGWLIIHRRNVGPAEVGVVRRLRHEIEKMKAGRPRLEVILGDLPRYSDVQELASLTDRITPESVAIDVFPARINRLRGKLFGGSRSKPLPAVGLLAQNRPMAEMLADCLSMVSLETVLANGWTDPALPSGSLMLWDVPTLNPRWDSELKAQSRRRPIISLLAMANREMTARARAAGAVACLDLPFEINDLHDLVLAHLPASTAASGTPQPRREARQDAVPMRSGTLIVRAEPGHEPFRGQSQRQSRTTAHLSEDL